jgi:hypothetical protein
MEEGIAEKIKRANKQGIEAGKAGKNPRYVLRFVKESEWYQAWLRGWASETHSIYHDIAPECWQSNYSPLKQNNFGSKVMAQSNGINKKLDNIKPCTTEFFRYPNDPWIWVKMKTISGAEKVVPIYAKKIQSSVAPNSKAINNISNSDTFSVINNLATIIKHIDPDPYSDKHYIPGYSENDLLSLSYYLNDQSSDLSYLAAVVITQAFNMNEKSELKDETYSEIESLLNSLLNSYDA